jgi:AcrR family transcriptional regulator
MQASDAREKILDAAETLFANRGYAAVTLRDIAAPLGLKHSSLYHHFPEGKETLFAEVLERNIRRHGQGLAAAMASSDGSLRGKLRGIAAWLLSQPPMDLLRIVESDLKVLPRKEAERIGGLVYAEIILRIRSAFEDAIRGGEVGDCDPGLLGGSVLGFFESLHTAPERDVGRNRVDMAHALIEIILKGIDYKERKLTR